MSDEPTTPSADVDDTDARPREGSPGEEPLHPGKAESLESLGEFVIAMIQAFLRTGYYLPDHPESQKAKEGLHEKFLALTQESGEITFFSREIDGRETIFIEGLADRPLRLKDLMTRGMAETYDPRIVSFLERKELISLSLGSRMNATEFSRFIDLMSEPSMADMRDASVKLNFADQIRERGIFHISFVFNEDFITAERNIPWRAALAISRLRKDLFQIPIFRKLSPEQIGEVRGELLVEILRPLTAPELVYAFLMNIDLAATENMPEEDAEDMIVSNAMEEGIIGVAPLFILDASGKKPLYLEKLAPEKTGRILTKLTRRLSEIGTEESLDELEEMFNAGLVPIEILPAGLRERIETARRVDTFLEMGDRILEKLEKIADPGAYCRAATSLVKVFVLLLEKKQVAVALTIADKLHAHGLEESPRGEIAREVLRVILAREGALEHAARLFLSEPKEERILLGRLFELVGESAVPALLGVIGETEDTWRRKQALRGLGLSNDARAHDILTQIISTAEGSGNDDGWDLAAVAVESLGRLVETGSAAKGKSASTLLELAERGYPKSRLKRLVRRSSFPAQVLVSLAGALGHLVDEASLEVITRMGDDKDEKVSRRAVDVLKSRGEN